MKKEYVAIGAGAAMLLAVAASAALSGGTDEDSGGGGGGGGYSDGGFMDFLNSVQDEQQAFFDKMNEPQETFDYDAPPMWGKEDPSYPEPMLVDSRSNDKNNNVGFWDLFKKSINPQKAVATTTAVAVSTVSNPVTGLAAGLGSYKIVTEYYKNKEKATSKATATESTPKTTPTNGGGGLRTDTGPKKSGGSGYGSARIVETAKTIVTTPKKEEKTFGSGGIGGGFGGGGGGLR